MSDGKWSQEQFSSHQFDSKVEIEEIMRELHAVNEEEIANEMQELINEVSTDETKESASTSKELLEDFKKKLVKDKLYSLSNKVDLLFEEEGVLSQLQEEQFEILLDSLTQKESALEQIKKDLESIRASSVQDYAVYLFDNHKKYYKKYIASKRFAVIESVKELTEETGEYLRPIPILAGRYTQLKTLANR